MVVVVYGAQRRRNVTGAVASVDKKRLEEVPNKNFAQALQASIPGLSIDQNAGGAEGPWLNHHSKITSKGVSMFFLKCIKYFCQSSA